MYMADRFKDALGDSGVAVIAGVGAEQFPRHIREHPRLVFWDSDSPQIEGHRAFADSLSGKNVKAVVCTRFMKHATYYKLQTFCKKRRAVLMGKLNGTGEISRMVDEALFPKPKPQPEDIAMEALHSSDTPHTDTHAQERAPEHTPQTPAPAAQAGPGEERMQQPQEKPTAPPPPPTPPPAPPVPTSTPHTPPAPVMLDFSTRKRFSPLFKPEDPGKSLTSCVKYYLWDLVTVHKPGKGKVYIPNRRHFCETTALKAAAHGFKATVDDVDGILNSARTHYMKARKEWEATFPGQPLPTNPDGTQRNTNAVSATPAPVAQLPPANTPHTDPHTEARPVLAQPKSDHPQRELLQELHDHIEACGELFDRISRAYDLLNDAHKEITDLRQIKERWTLVRQAAAS